MALSESSRTRLISWLKIVLPLAAMAILSTLFLISRSIDPLAEIPYSTVDLRDSARSERVTKPSFAGATEEGDMIAFTAESALPRDGNRLDANNLAAEIDFAGGGSVAVRAETGQIDQPADTATLRGGVEITSSTGYRVETEALAIGMRQTRAETEGEIRAEGPPGTFTAGRMRLSTDPETGKVYMVFTAGVKLIYDPGSTPGPTEE